MYDHYLIGCTPTSATITHRNTVTETENGKERTSYSRSVHVLEKRGDRWQVVSNAGHPLAESTVLLYLEGEWNEAEMKRDAAWFERTLTDDYTGVDGRTGKPTTKAQDIADIKTNTVESTDLSGVEVRMQGGDTAVVTGLTHNKGKDAKGVGLRPQSPFHGRLGQARRQVACGVEPRERSQVRLAVPRCARLRPARGAARVPP